MHIDSYDFGHIVIDGVSYSQDVLIWPGHVKKDWWLPTLKSSWWAKASLGACRLTRT
jgi:hypothetical protein